MRHGRKKRLITCRGEDDRIRGRAKFAYSVGKHKRLHCERGHSLSRRARASQNVVWDECRKEFWYEVVNEELDLDCNRDSENNEISESNDLTSCVSPTPPIKSHQAPLLKRAVTARHARQEMSRWDEAISKAECIAMAWIKAHGHCSDDGSFPKNTKKKLHLLRDTMEKFECFREKFLRLHGAEIRKNLQNCFDGPISLIPTPIAQHVKNRFLDHFKGFDNLLPTLHGTCATNHQSIFAHGLVVPGGSNAIRVRNASSHGVGIYTAKVSNALLSREFCTAPCMLVCAVVDDAVMLNQPVRLGNFMMTAESGTVRHVGDAVVVFDPGCIAPIFEARGLRFKYATPLAPAAPSVVVVQDQIVPPVPCHKKKLVSSTPRIGAVGTRVKRGTQRFQGSGQVILACRSAQKRQAGMGVRPLRR